MTYRTHPNHQQKNTGTFHFHSWCVFVT